ncbi:MAG: transcriptional repressor [Oscillospiraceae bacterium]|nr:transcriptional repressor [Oscillospiraceae bacterium]
MPAVQRYSQKREAILNALRMTNSHPSAEWIYLQTKQQYPDISLGTVYRNLSQFKEQGTIITVATVNGVERFDANTEPHVHFICQSCGKVQDLHQMEVPSGLCLTAARETGAKIDQCWLTFHGSCADCKTIQNQ